MPIEVPASLPGLQPAGKRIPTPSKPVIRARVGFAGYEKAFDAQTALARDVSAQVAETMDAWLSANTFHMWPKKRYPLLTIHPGHPLPQAIADRHLALSRLQRGPSPVFAMIDTLPGFLAWAYPHPDFPRAVHQDLPHALMTMQTPGDWMALQPLLAGTADDAAIEKLRQKPGVAPLVARLAPMLQLSRFLDDSITALGITREQDFTQYATLRRGLMRAAYAPTGKARLMESVAMMQALVRGIPNAAQNAGLIQIVAETIALPLTQPAWDNLRERAESTPPMTRRDLLDVLVQHHFTHPGHWFGERSPHVLTKEWMSPFSTIFDHSIVGADLVDGVNALRRTHPTHAILFGKWAAEDNAKAFESLFPHLMATHSDPTLIARMMSVHERRMDHIYNQYGHSMMIHPNEAEMMAAGLGNPHFSLAQLGDDIHRVNRGITSISYFMGWRVNKLPQSVLSLWGRAGNWSHAFLGLKYDTQHSPTPGEKRLIEEYGAVSPLAYLKDLDNPDKPQVGVLKALEARYGPAQVMGANQWSARRVGDKAFFGKESLLPPDFPIDDRTVMVLYQPFIVVTHPDWGTLIVRNSSGNPKAGRNLKNADGELILPHPIYWSPTPMGSDAVYMDPARVLNAESQVPTLGNSVTSLLKPGKTQFLHILDPNLYLFKSDDETAREQFLNRFPEPARFPHRQMGHLLDNLDAWRDHYADWKLNPSGTEKYLSPGRKPFLAMALRQGRSRLADGKPPLTLALAPRRHPGFLSYPWTDTKNSPQTVYTLDPSHLAEVDAFLNHHYEDISATRARQTVDLFRFLEAGLAMRADIIVRDAQHV